MKVLTIFVIALAAANANPSNWTSFHAKYGTFGLANRALGNAFWDMPTDPDSMAELGWTEIENENDYNLVSYALGGTDYSLIIMLYEDKIAAIQYGVSYDEVEKHKPPTTNMSKNPMYEVKTVLDTNLYTSTVLLVSPDVLEAGTARTNTDALADGVWFKNSSSSTGFTQVVENEDEALASGYTKQACIPFMGTHYYYHMNKNSDCNLFSPFFIMYNKGKLWAIGWQFLGKIPVSGRDYWDDIGYIAAKATVPNGPSCLANWVQKYGSTSMHLYFTEKPWLNLNC